MRPAHQSWEVQWEKQEAAPRDLHLEGRDLSTELRHGCRLPAPLPCRQAVVPGDDPSLLLWSQTLILLYPPLPSSCSAQQGPGEALQLPLPQVTTPLPLGSIGLALPGNVMLAAGPWGLRLLLGCFQLLPLRTTWHRATQGAELVIIHTRETELGRRHQTSA